MLLGAVSSAAGGFTTDDAGNWTVNRK